MPSSSTQFGTYQTTRAPFFTKRTPAIRNGCLFSSEVCWDSVDSCNEYCAAITRSETSDETSLSTMIDVGNGTSFERSRIIRLWDAYAQYIQKTNTGFRQFSWCCWSIMLIKDTKLLVNLGDLEPPKNFLVGEINEEIRAVSVSETGKKSCMRDMNPKVGSNLIRKALSSLCS